MWITLFVILFKGCSFLNTTGNVDSRISDEYRLADELMKGYNHRVRPIYNSSHAMEIFVELSLFNVLDLDTINQQMITHTKLIMKWQDIFLKWNPLNYGNLQYLRIDHTKIWYPDIVLYNVAVPDYDASVMNTNAIISWNGEVTLVSDCTFVSVCNFDIQWYPFDEQICEMVFASWTYDVTKIRLKLGPADMSDYHDNPEFFLENFYANQSESFNPCCKNSMSTIFYFIQMQRRTKFSLFFFIMPGILINACAILVFSLPMESSEKMVLGISSMLAMIVFLMEMTLYIPPTDVIPQAGLYYGVCLALVTINIGCSVFIMNINVSGERGRPVPYFMKQLTLTLARYFKNELPEVVIDNWGIYEDDGIYRMRPQLDHVINVRSFTDKSTAKSSTFISSLHDDDLKVKGSYEPRMMRALDTMLRDYEHEERCCDSSTQESTLKIEWKFISRVLDRFSFYLFIFIIVLVNVFLLATSPFSEDFKYCPFTQEQCDDMTREEILELAHQGIAHTF